MSNQQKSAMDQALGEYLALGRLLERHGYPETTKVFEAVEGLLAANRPAHQQGEIDEALVDLFDSAQNDKIGQDAFVGRVRALFAGATPAKYLVIAMDDDGNGNPHYCADESAVESVVTELMFSDPGDYQKETGKLHAADLIEEGFINFEGDPGIHLYRLPGA